jgi:hypothetical protein
MPQNDELWEAPSGRLRGRLRGMSAPASTVTADDWTIGTCRVAAPGGHKKGVHEVTRRQIMMDDKISYKKAIRR